MTPRATVLAVWMLTVLSTAAGAGERWETWRMQRNFPWNLVTSIVPDGDRVWFGGRKLLPGEQDGLAYYDKRTSQWHILLDTEGVLSEDINRIALHEGKVWIASDGWRPFNQGLAVFDPATADYRRYTQADGLPHWRIRDIAFDDESAWIATQNGVGRYDLATGAWSAFSEQDGLASRFLICAAADRDHAWFGSFEGLEMFDRRTGRWQSHRRGQSPLPAHAQAVLPDGDRVWIASPPHILTYEKGSRRFRVFAEGRAAGAAEVTHIRRHGDELFFGTTTGGLHVWHLVERHWQVHTTDHGLGDDHVYALGVDADYVWCAGSRGSPLSRLDRRSGRWRHYYYRDELPANFLFSLVRTGNWLLAGTMGNGFWKYDLTAGRWHNLNVRLLVNGQDYLYQADQTPIQVADIYTLLKDGDQVWMGTNHGLGRYRTDWSRPGFEVIEGPTDAMLALARWQDRVMAGTRQGLQAYDPAGSGWSEIDTGPLGRRRAVHALLADEATLWLGTASGLWRMTALDAPPEPAHDPLGSPVTALLKTGDTLWLGARDGLFRHDTASGTRVRIDIPATGITSLAGTADALWIGTRNGLFRYVPDTGSFAHHTQESTGLGWNHVNSLTWDDQHLWVGTLGGGLSRGTLSPPGERQ